MATRPSFWSRQTQMQTITCLPNKTLRCIILFGACYLMLLGVVMVLMGALYSTDLWKSNSSFLFTDDVNFLVREAVIGFGVWTMIVSMFGLFVLCIGNTNCLLVLVAILCLTLLIQWEVTVSFIRKELSEKQRKKELQIALKEYKEGGLNKKSTYIDTLAYRAKCCGITNHTMDFANMTYKDTETRVNIGVDPTMNTTSVPFSCCRQYKPSMSDLLPLKECLENPTEENAHTKGCLDQVSDMARHLTRVAFYIIVGAQAVQVLLGLCSFVLFSSKRHSLS